MGLVQSGGDRLISLARERFGEWALKNVPARVKCRWFLWQSGNSQREREIEIMIRILREIERKVGRDNTSRSEVSLKSQESIDSSGLVIKSIMRNEISRGYQGHFIAAETSKKEASHHSRFSLVTLAIFLLGA